MSPSEIVSTDPCTDETVWAGPAADRDSLDNAVAMARRGFAAWSVTPLDARIAVARRFAELAKARRGDLATLLARETGKPLWEALTEIDSVAGKIEISIKAQAERAGTRQSENAGITAAVRHKPHGVLAVLGPFNFPMHLPNGHIAPALLAGNALVFKPSEKTPACGLALAALWQEAGVPAEAIVPVVGGPDIGQALVVHPDTDGILFTGSARAGIAINRALADRPDKLVALELGGDNPLIAWDVADAESAAHLIVQSAFVSAGQRCSCARRLIVEAGPRGDAVIDALLATVDRIRIDAPFEEPAPFMGPVIDRPAAEHLERAFAGLTSGGTVLRPLARLRGDLPFLAPAVIARAAGTGAGEELFGPILQIVRTPTFEAAVAAANDTRYGLAAGLISRRRDLYERFWAQARAGIVNWNRPTTGASSAAPFGGIGLSGNHRPSAYYAADYCTYPVAGLETKDATFRIGTGLS